MSMVISGEKIVYGFLRGDKKIEFSASDDVVGKITATTNTGDPQVLGLETLRGRESLVWGAVSGDTDFVLYVSAGTLTCDFEVNDFIVESEKNIENGVVISADTYNQLTPEQTAAGADAVVGTNDQDELINKRGGRDFKAQFIPRKAPLASLKALTNNTGEIAVASDKKALVVLGGYGSSEPYVIYGMPKESGLYYTNTILTGLSTFVDEATTPDEIANLDSQNCLYKIQSGQFTEISAQSMNLVVKPTITAVSNDGPTYAQNERGTLLFTDQQGNFLFYATGATEAGTSPPRVGFFGQSSAQIINTIAGGSRTSVPGGNAVDDNDTFNGGSGQGYTIGQIVRALKNFGFLAE